MAHTNSTAHYNLPQYVGTDIINPLTDTNGAYEAIDTALYEQGQAIAGVGDDVDALEIQNGDSALDTTAQTLSGAINELKASADALGDRVTTNETNIGTLQTQMSTATGNITTLNTTVSGLQTEVASKASATALNNLTTKVGTGNLDTVAQNCVDAINEVNAKIPEGGSVNAEDVVYDNTESGISATNVQDAIDICVSTDAIREGEIANNRTNVGYLMDYTLNADIPIGTKGTETVYRHIFESQQTVGYQTWASVYATDIDPSKVLSISLACDTSIGAYSGGNFISAKIEGGYVKLLQEISDQPLNADWIVTIEFTKANA